MRPGSYFVYGRKPFDGNTAADGSSAAAAVGLETPDNAREKGKGKAVEPDDGRTRENKRRKTES